MSSFWILNTGTDHCHSLSSHLVRCLEQPVREDEGAFIPGWRSPASRFTLPRAEISQPFRLLPLYFEQPSMRRAGCFILLIFKPYGLSPVLLWILFCLQSRYLCLMSYFQNTEHWDWSLSSLSQQPERPGRGGVPGCPCWFIPSLQAKLLFNILSF